MGVLKGLLMDASVLIDFCETDTSVLKLVSDHIGRVHVPTPVLIEEVERVRRKDWSALGIVPVDPPLETALLAAQGRPGLSFYDMLCLLVARDNGWTCVTNDARLRRECAAENVPVLWGLELIALLAESGALTQAAATEVGRAIQEANHPVITQDA